MPPHSETDSRTLAKVSALYYLRGQTQQAIADRLRVSRPTVSRMIQEARRRGIVQITIAHVDGLSAELEGEIEGAFGLREAVVADVSPDTSDAELRTQLGAAAAGFLNRILDPGAVVGLTWGTTLREMVKAVTPRRADGVTIVQTLGGVGPPLAEAHAADLPRRLAGLLGADLRLIQAPGIVASPGVREALASDPQIRSTLDALRTLSVAFVGIGALETNPVLGEGELASELDMPEGLWDELTASGAVGDMALRFFDAEGRPVHTSLDDRIIGVDLATLANVDCVVGVAGGAAKVEVIRAALRGGLLDVLITDDHTARALLVSS